MHLTRPKLKLHGRQWKVYKSKARFRVVVAGRRFGKTQLAIVEMIRAAMGKGRVVWYVGPNDDQSKSIVWTRLKEMTRKWWTKTPSETELRIELQWGSTITVNGAFKPDNLRGNGIDFLVLDEFASMAPEAWNEVFRPALADRKGRALFIGTPQGRNHFYDHFEYAQSDPDWEAFHFTTADGGLVDADELAGAARQLDPESYSQEFEAKFTSVGRNRAYYAFDRSVNVQPVRFDGEFPLVWSIDFNINPMSMLIMQRREDDVVYVVEEIIVKPEASTESACQAFLARANHIYSHLPSYQRPLTVKVYGDASGNQRRTSGLNSDWTIIKAFFKNWVGTFVPHYFYSPMNPSVRERIACVNSRLRNQQGDTRLFIDPSCRELIKDLEEVCWALDSTGAPIGELNKSDRARTHSSDALGYFISKIFPIRGTIGEQQTGRIV